jgi:hypothetical protein
MFICRAMPQRSRGSRPADGRRKADSSIKRSAIGYAPHSLSGCVGRLIRAGGSEEYAAVASLSRSCAFEFSGSLPNGGRISKHVKLVLRQNFLPHQRAYGMEYFGFRRSVQLSLVSVQLAPLDPSQTVAGTCERKVESQDCPFQH